MSDITATTSPQMRDIGDFFSLLKPRVMSLVVFTGAVGLFVAPVQLDLVLAFSSILFIALGAGASGALNMWWDEDIDRIMRRTKGRPIPAGKVVGSEALMLGLWLSVLSVAMLGLVSNWWAAAFLAFTIFFYAVIYTMWLKRSTPQNIVIGGAAGAFPPAIGWLAATGNIGVEAIAMFLLIFCWTPPHFWALALFMTDDYSNAGVPMLNVTHGRKATRGHIFIYALILAIVALGVAFTSIGGPIYFGAAVILTVLFTYGAWQVYRRNDEASFGDDHKSERALFKLSLIYLFILFAALALEAALPSTLYLPFDWPEVI